MSSGIFGSMMSSWGGEEEEREERGRRERKRRGRREVGEEEEREERGRREGGEEEEREERGRRGVERKEGEEERILQTKADTNNSLLHFLPSTHTHLSCEGQKIVVEVYIGHNIGEVF